MNRSRAFTLIEVLVSVILISVVVLGIVKIREQSFAAAHYLEERMGEELADTLFLGKEALKYRGEKKDAYTLLRRLGIKNSATIDLLRSQERIIRTGLPLSVDQSVFPIQVREISVKRKYSDRYYRLIY